MKQTRRESNRANAHASCYLTRALTRDTHSNPSIWRLIHELTRMWLSKCQYDIVNDKIVQKGIHKQIQAVNWNGRLYFDLFARTSLTSFANDSGLAPKPRHSTAATSCSRVSPIKVNKKFSSKSQPTCIEHLWHLVKLVDCGCSDVLRHSKVYLTFSKSPGPFLSHSDTKCW